MLPPVMFSTHPQFGVAPCGYRSGGVCLQTPPGLPMGPATFRAPGLPQLVPKTLPPLSPPRVSVKKEAKPAAPTTPRVNGEDEGPKEMEKGEGVWMRPRDRATAGSAIRECATWRIGRFAGKVKDSLGRPLVSPEFSACGVEGLRLMVCPEVGPGWKGPRGRKEKELFAKKITSGRLNGSLKLKVPSMSSPQPVEYCLRVGAVRTEPLKHDFSVSTVSDDGDFGIDWLSQVASDESLTVGVEIFEIQALGECGENCVAESAHSSDDERSELSQHVLPGDQCD